MFLLSEEREEIILRKRLNTIKAAIEEGAHIVPAYFFGNTRLFHTTGGGSDSFLSKISRSMRISAVLFYGRHYLPVPYR